MESATKVAPRGLERLSPGSCKAGKPGGTGPALGTNTARLQSNAASASASDFQSEPSRPEDTQERGIVLKFPYELAEQEHLRKA